MARQGLSEILEETSKQDPEFAGEYLRAHWNPTLGQLIRYAYDATFQWDLPEGTPPYTVNQYLDQESNLYSEVRRLYVFMKGSGDHVPQRRKELLFVQLLESLSKADAELLCQVKDRTLPYGISIDFIVRELPGQLASPISQEPVAEVTQTNETFQLDSASEPSSSDASDGSVETVITPPAPARKPAARKPVAKGKPAAKKTVARKAKA